jgi:hypothetical protein
MANFFARKPRRTAIPYSSAIYWLAQNDDNEYARTTEAAGEDPPPLSVAASLVADIYSRTDIEVLADLRQELARDAA